MQRHAAPEMNLQAAVRMAQTTNPSRGSCHEQLLALTPGGERRIGGRQRSTCKVDGGGRRCQHEGCS
jgi:hypothetical protein